MLAQVKRTKADLQKLLVADLKEELTELDLATDGVKYKMLAVLGHQITYQKCDLIVIEDTL